MAHQSPTASDKSTGRSVRHSRNGCVACKDRRRRCTEEKPSCARCVAENRICRYGLRLKWEDESRKRGVKHGRGTQPEVRFVDPIPPVELIKRGGWKALHTMRKYFLNTYTSDIEADHDQQLRHFCGIRFGIQSTSPRYSLGNYALQSTDGSLFQYYETQICCRLTLVDDSSNGFRSIVLPIAHAYNSVMYAVLATSALNLSLGNGSGFPGYYTLALQHKQKALSYLRNEIANLGESASHILVSMLMLCHFDITDGCQISWPEHVKAASNLLQSGNVAAKDPSLATFVSKFFASRDIMGRSACGKRSKFTEVASFHSLEIDKSWGCSYEIMTTIASITDLSRRKVATLRGETQARDLQIDSEASNQVELTREIADLESRLENAIQIMPPLDPLVPRTQAMLLPQTATLIQNAANIYFYTALHSAGPGTLLVHNLIASQMELLGKLPSLCGTHLWSIFVTALYANGDEERLFFLNQFDKLESVRPAIGSALAARAVMETVWKRRDLDADSDGKDIGLSDWERYVKPLSEGLSLA